MKEQLEQVFGAEIEIDGEATKGTTGEFEVSIVGGKTIHSKKGGDGFVDTDGKRDQIVKAIRAAMQ